MRKKGFTIIELLVVISLIGVLLVIGIPAAFTISKKIKQNMLDSKIELIEAGAVVWGQTNESKIKMHAESENCTFVNDYTYCVKKSIGTMLNTEKIFKEDIIESNVKHLINPITDSSINDCYVEIYIKNKRVYAKYDIRDVGSTKCYYDLSTLESEEKSELKEIIKLNDALLRDNEVENPISIPGKNASLTNEAVFSSIEDDFGTSYYFRGAVENNYVTYSGMCWRVVRIMGNGDIKITLADRNNECGTINGYDINDNQSAFVANPANQRFSYKYFNAAYDVTDFVYKNSNIAIVLNAWAGINGDRSYMYLDKYFNANYDEFTTQKLDLSKLSQTPNWCIDMKVSSIDSYGINYFGSYVRLYPSSVSYPSLKCAGYLENESKVGLLSADEVALAGATYYQSGVVYNYYLITNAAACWYWTLSPAFLDSPNNSSNILRVSSQGSLGNMLVADDGAIRPTVVLKSDVELSTETDYIQDGTVDKPYVIE